MRPLTDKALRWLTFSPNGAVTVDLNAALRSTEGRRQLARAWFVAGCSGRTKAHERATLSRFLNAVYGAAQDAPKCLNRHGRGSGYSAPKGGGDALYAKAGDA